ESRQPRQRIGAARNDRTENQPVAENAVENEERESLKVPTAQFVDDGRTQIQEVAGTIWGSFDRVHRRIHFSSESQCKPVGNLRVFTLELPDVLRKLRVENHPHRSAARYCSSVKPSTRPVAMSS